MSNCSSFSVILECPVVGDILRMAFQVPLIVSRRCHLKRPNPRPLMEYFSWKVELYDFVLPMMSFWRDRHEVSLDNRSNEPPGRRLDDKRRLRVARRREDDVTCKNEDRGCDIQARTSHPAASLWMMTDTGRYVTERSKSSREVCRVALVDCVLSRLSPWETNRGCVTVDCRI